MAQTTTGKKQPAGLSSAYQRFAYIVSRGSGLDYHVVEAWLLAEGGPSDNPLNIGPGRHYGSVDKAADATLRTLRDPKYAGVRKSVRGSAQDQIAAIAASPWDAGHYSGGTKSQGALLRGTYARVKGAPPPKISGSHGNLFPGANIVAGVADASAGDTGLASSETGLGGIVSDVENWLATESVVAVSYAALLAAAVALFVLGVLRATGRSPADIARAAGPRAATGEIPF